MADSIGGSSATTSLNQSSTFSSTERLSTDFGGEDEPIEIDDGFSDADSTMDDRIAVYTETLTSSVVMYPTENGRRYHAFRPGSYFAPNDEREVDRLDYNHALVLKVLNCNLFLAPVNGDKTHRILDIGTGTGAIDVGDLFPNAEVIGNDLSAIQPAWVPPNVKFEIDDIESPWVHNSKFDFIFSRYLAGAIRDWPRLVGNIYDNLNPGGWAEFQDYDFLFQSEDGSLTEEHHTWNWDRTFISAAASIGLESRPGAKIEDWVRKAGFVNVVHYVCKLPIGPWAKDPFYKDIGMCNLIQILEGLEAFTLRIFCGVLGWSRDKVMSLLDNVRRELKSDAFHAHGNLHVVYCQKPPSVAIS